MENTDSRSVESTTDVRRDLSSLQFRVERFTEQHLQLVAAFSARHWPRPQTESFYRWRYLESLPFSRLFLALTDDECLGMVFALRKPYIIAGEPARCLEVFDWHSLPGLRGSGVGIRVMRAMMREGERLIAVGGTPDVLKTLPAMGWQAIGSARSYELPITGDALAPGFRERVPVRVPGDKWLLSAVARLWFQPRHRRGPGRAAVVSMIGPETDSLYTGETGYDLLQTPDATFLRWITAGYPGNGSFVLLYFTIQDRLRGWAMTRVYETALGREAAIVEVFAPKPDVALYRWMIAEAASLLVGARPRLIRARASCPILQAALAAERFRPGDESPIHTYPRTLPAQSRVHITLNHTDETLRPYPNDRAITRFLVS